MCVCVCALEVQMVVSSLDGAGNLGPLQEEPVPLTIKLSLKKYYIYSILPACVPAGQKRAPDLIRDGCESPCGSGN